MLGIPLERSIAECKNYEMDTEEFQQFSWQFL